MSCVEARSESSVDGHSAGLEVLAVAHQAASAGAVCPDQIPDKNTRVCALPCSRQSSGWVLGCM